MLRIYTVILGVLRELRPVVAQIENAETAAHSHPQPRRPSTRTCNPPLAPVRVDTGAPPRRPLGKGCKGIRELSHRMK